MSIDGNYRAIYRMGLHNRHSSSRVNAKKPRRAYTWDKRASALWAERLDSPTISLWGSGPTHRGFATARGC